MSGKYVVLVTGGSGCLGQHIIKLLQTRATYVDEIRIIDVVPFVKKLDYDDRVPVTSHVQDISDLQDTSAFSGVTSVFHLASVISVNNFPDYELMERVNVLGTSQVLKACLKEDVGHMVYASTVDVVCGYEDIVDGTEDGTRVSDTLIYDGYGGTKVKAEHMVLSYNGERLNSGGVLHTVSLRPTVMFGELDTHYIPEVLQKANSNGGVLVQLGDGSARFEQTYVGNVAWAFICADQTLRKEDCLSESAMKNESSLESIGRNAFFITDDWEAKGMGKQVEPFLRAVGCRLSNYKLPFTPIYGSVILTESLLWLISPLKKVDLGFSSKSLRYLNTTYTYSNAKARAMLGYAPIYTPEESLDLANKYYVSLFPDSKKEVK